MPIIIKSEKIREGLYVGYQGIVKSGEDIIIMGLQIKTPWSEGFAIDLKIEGEISQKKLMSELQKVKNKIDKIVNLHLEAVEKMKKRQMNKDGEKDKKEE